MKSGWLGFLLLFSAVVCADFRPPAFSTGIPGRMQMQSLEIQRHQARTLLYREALEELKRNPQVVDVHECNASDTDQTYCLPEAAPAGVPASIAQQPTARRVALLIGNDQYQAPIPPLLTPIHDVQQLAARLKQTLGYEVRVLTNASKAEIVGAVAALARETTQADAVFVYYAGHGYLLEDTEMGYWIPSDGSVKTAKQWISNQDIARLMRAIPARQVLLVSDSCFSGTLVSGSDISSTVPVPAEVLRKRSVMVLSSGGEEPVSDEGQDGHSVFAWHFLSTLQQLQGTELGFALYEKVSSGVREDYPQQPQYGAVSQAGHEAGGEYLFEQVVQ